MVEQFTNRLCPTRPPKKTKLVSTTPALLFPQTFALAAFGLAQRHSPLFALGNKVALPLGITQNPVLGHLFSESLQQAFRRLSRSCYYSGHTHLPPSGIYEKADLPSLNDGFLSCTVDTQPDVWQYSQSIRMDRTATARADAIRSSL